MNLSSADQARGRELITRYYPSLSEFHQTLFNEQLADCRNYYEWQDWGERLELTAKYFEDGSGKIKAARRRVTASSRSPTGTRPAGST